MDTRNVETRHFALINHGDCGSWTDPFTDDQIMDEQLADRVDARRFFVG